MLQLNPMYAALQRPPATATRATELTPYEKIIKYMLEAQRDYATGDVELMKKRNIPQSGNGGCSISTFYRVTDVVVKKQLFGENAIKRRVIIEFMLADLVKNGFIELDQSQRPYIYHLTDKYKTVDVNTLLNGSDE
ncbi:hypothetical protein P3911_004483 [Salmonella enterica]|nr:hypothetical protein [Salmonella enterica]